MMGLHLLDWLVLGGYFAALVLIGIVTAAKIRDSQDFFMPRKFGRAMMIMFSFGTGTHSDQAVSVASKSFTSGLSGIWYQWLWLPVTPFYWLIAPMFRRFRAITTSDVFEARYSRSVAMLFAVVGVVNLAVNIGLMLRGSSEVIAASTSGQVNTNVAIAIMTVIFVVYGVAGGLSAAIITDFIQGVLTILFSFLLLPLVLNAVGGLEGIRSNVADKGMLSLVAPGDIGVFYIAVISFNALVGIVTQPHTMGNCAAGKTETEGRIGFMGGTLIKRLCTIPWALTGLAGVVYFAGVAIHPDKVFGTIASEFLPKVTHGALGLFLAAILASVMSSCDAFMISSSALFTENVYKPLRPDREKMHYVTVGRITAALVVVGGVVFAYALRSVVQGLEIFWKISPAMGIAFWLGLFWRRATVAGAWAGTLSAFGVWLVSETGYFVGLLKELPFAEQLNLVATVGPVERMYLPWQMVFYLATGTAAAIVVSLLSRPVDKGKLERFYELVRTPVRPAEKVDKPCTLPEDAVVPPRRVLFPNTSLEIMVPSVTSVVGFFAGWTLVAGLIGSVYWIVSAGLQ